MSNNPLVKRIRALEGTGHDGRMVYARTDEAAEEHWSAHPAGRNIYIVTDSVASLEVGETVADMMKRVARYGRSIVDRLPGPISSDRLWSAPRQ